VTTLNFDSHNLHDKQKENVAVILCWTEPPSILSFSVPPLNHPFLQPIPAPNLTPEGMAPVTKLAIEDVIDKVIRSDSTLMKEIESFGLRLSRAKDADDWDKISICEGIPQDVSVPLLDAVTPWFFGIQILNAEIESEDEDKICGVITFYIAFSSWNGRILYLDRLSYPKDNQNVEKLFIRVLASVASDLQFARLTWRVRNWCVNHSLL
jgi:hypothetical protein